MGRLATGRKWAQKRVQLSAGDESEAYPQFARWQAHRLQRARQSKVGAFHVFVRELPSGKPRRLTQEKAATSAGVVARWRYAGLPAHRRWPNQCIPDPSDAARCANLPISGRPRRGKPLPAVS